MAAEKQTLNAQRPTSNVELVESGLKAAPRVWLLFSARELTSESVSSEAQRFNRNREAW
jgi:hypothetical protein